MGTASTLTKAGMTIFISFLLLPFAADGREGPSALLYCMVQFALEMQIIFQTTRQARVRLSDFLNASSIRYLVVHLLLFQLLA